MPDLNVINQKCVYLNSSVMQPPAHGPQRVAHERLGGRDAERAQRGDLISRRHLNSAKVSKFRDSNEQACYIPGLS